MNFPIKNYLLSLLTFSLGFGISYKYYRNNNKESLVKIQKTYTDGEIVRALNSRPSAFEGTVHCQTKEEAMKYGGRLCYYISAYAYPRAGALLLPVAVKMNGGIIEDIYIGFATRKNGNTAVIGGFFDPVDKAPLALDSSIRTPIESSMYKERLKHGKLQNKMEVYYPPETYVNAEQKNLFREPIKEKNHDRNYIDNVLRETKEETSWNLTTADLLTTRPVITAESDHEWSQITAFFPAYIGELSENGNLEDQARNILIKNYQAPGYDDIDHVAFLSITSFKNIDGSINIGTIKIKRDSPDLKTYQEITYDIVNYVIQKKYNLTLDTLAKLRLVDPSISNFIKNGFDGSNNKKLLQYLAKYHQKNNN